MGTYVEFQLTDDAAESPDEVVDLAGSGAANGVRNADTVYTGLVHGLV